jgi:serine/threonine protein kinase
MEELQLINVEEINKEVLVETMKKVKDFLQKLGIMYIDWKIDNIGISDDGKYKLFDFDASGIVDLNTNKWILEPANFWSYKEAKKNGRVTPQEIDDWSFNYNILGK